MLNRPRAAGAPDGPRPRARPEAATCDIAARGDLDRAGARKPRPLRGRRPGRRGRVAREHQARVRRRAAAPAAAPARCADPVRGAALEGERGRRAAVTSVPSVNSALQRARATLEARDVSAADPSPPLSARPSASCSHRYVDAFERYDMDALTALIHEDATQSMPPYELWLRGRDDILAWWFGPGIGCRGSRVIPTVSANGSPAFGQYKPSETRQRLRPVGAAGDRDPRRADHRVHLLPRDRDPVSAVRAAAIAWTLRVDP